MAQESLVEEDISYLSRKRILSRDRGHDRQVGPKYPGRDVGFEGK